MNAEKIKNIKEEDIQTKEDRKAWIERQVMLDKRIYATIDGGEMDGQVVNICNSKDYEKKLKQGLEFKNWEATSVEETLKAMINN